MGCVNNLNFPRGFARPPHTGAHPCPPFRARVGHPRSPARKAQTPTAPLQGSPPPLHGVRLSDYEGPARIHLLHQESLDLTHLSDKEGPDVTHDIN